MKSKLFKQRKPVEADVAPEGYKFDLFSEMLNNFKKERRITTEDASQPAFIIARFYSMHTDTFDIAASYNDISRNLPDWARRVVLYHLTPHKRKPPYMRYIKSEKLKRTEKELLIISKIQKHFGCRPVHAEQIYDILISQGVKPGNFFGL